MQDSQQNEQVETMKCERCQMDPEDYIELDCKHTFCLICLSYTYLQYINDPVEYIFY